MGRGSISIHAGSSPRRVECDGGNRFKVPFFLIQGSDDHITPAPLAATYFQKITATTKRMTLIDGAGLLL
jgi:pimeloyl-ACP methyl ester carboxylesterase